MPRALCAIGTKKPVQTGQMRKKGVEPIHPNREQEPESCASTNFATFAYEKQCKTTATTNRRRHALYSRTPPYASFFCLSALFAAFLGRSMSLSLHTSFFWGRALYVAIAPYELFLGAPYRQSRYGTPAATLLPASGQYAPLSPYCLRQYGLWLRLFRFRSIRLRSCATSLTLNTRPCRPIACGNTGSFFLNASIWSL